MLQSHSWKQSGSVALWRYTENQRNYPGWNITADATGCASLLALLDAFEADGVPASQTVLLSKPTREQLRVPNNRSAAWLAAEKLRLAYEPSITTWSFPEALDLAELTIGPGWLAKLRAGIAGIPRGEGDYSIGTSARGSLSLWFWW